jgi:hypothetical protein
MSLSEWPLPTLPPLLCYSPLADSHLALYPPCLSLRWIHPRLGKERVQTSG